VPELQATIDAFNRLSNQNPKPRHVPRPDDNAQVGELPYDLAVNGRLAFEVYLHLGI
jgi:hypothetical protein